MGGSYGSFEYGNIKGVPFLLQARNPGGIIGASLGGALAMALGKGPGGFAREAAASWTGGVWGIGLGYLGQKVYYAVFGRTDDKNTQSCGEF